MKLVIDLGLAIFIQCSEFIILAVILHPEDDKSIDLVEGRGFA